VVAREPTSRRLPLERVDAAVLVDRAAGVVYALDDGLVALDLRTGAETWRAHGVRGDGLWRLGSGLAVTAPGKPKAMPIQLIDVHATDTPRLCTVSLPAPPEAAEASLHPFDRGGAPLVSWTAGYSDWGGVPPGPDSIERTRRALSCGVLALNASSCAVKQVPQSAFLWQSPDDPAPGDRNRCGWWSPLRDLPAAAASEPPAASGAEPHLAVIRVREGKGCTTTVHATLTATQAGRTLWLHPLADRRETCPPP
jgi:hypothetical protein